MRKVVRKVVKISEAAFDLINRGGDEPFHVKLDRVLFSKAERKKAMTKVTEIKGFTTAAIIGSEFKKHYKARFKQEYPAWGVKENSIIKNWLRSVSLEHAIKLCEIYPRWSVPFVTKSGHPLELLIKLHVKLWSDYTLAHEKALILERDRDSREGITENAKLARFAESGSATEAINLLPRSEDELMLPD